MKTTLYLALSCAFFFSANLLFAQTATLNTVAIPTIISPSPQQISASDGTYAKYVLIKWMSPGSAQSFQVYKSPDLDINNATLLNKKTLESSWLLDYDVRPGKKYNYWVKATYDAEPTSPYSQTDQGYAANVEKIALDEAQIEASMKNLAINAPERYITNPYLEPMINDTRSLELEDVNIVSPIKNVRLAPAHDLMLEFNGTIENTELLNQKLILHIYTNDKDNFIEDLTLVKTILEQTKIEGEERSSFSTSIPFPYPNGLYYYAIQLADGDEPLKIGRITIQQE